MKLNGPINPGGSGLVAARADNSEEQRELLSLTATVPYDDRQLSMHYGTRLA